MLVLPIPGTPTARFCREENRFKPCGFARFGLKMLSCISRSIVTCHSRVHRAVGFDSAQRRREAMVPPLSGMLLTKINCQFLAGLDFLILR